MYCLINSEIRDQLDPDDTPNTESVDLEDGLNVQERLVFQLIQHE